MHIKHLSLIALLATSVAAQATLSDKFIYGASMTTVVASPFLAALAYYQTQENAAVISELEAEIPGLPERLEKLKLEAQKEEEKDPRYLFWVNRQAVYESFVSKNSELYQQLMQFTAQRNKAVLALFASIAAGGFSYQLAQKYAPADLAQE